MKRNMEITRADSTRVSRRFSCLPRRDSTAKIAYEAVRKRAAMKAWREGGSFAENLAAEPTVANYLS